MDIEDDLRRIALQEERLRFEAFDADTAWALGSAMRAAGHAAGGKIVVDIRLYSMRLLSFAMPGAMPDNFDWARRKRNVVFRFQRASYEVGLRLKRDQSNLQQNHGLPERDYAAHGGSFPLLLKGTGCIGAVTVSGLPSREDHKLVVEAIAGVLGIKLGDAALL